MATNLFGATSLIGGGTGALDSIKIAQIQDGDIAFVVNNSDEEFYVYTFDSGNVAAEDDLKVIYPATPDGTKAWLLCDITTGIATVLETLGVTGNSNFAANVDIDGTLTFDGAGPAIIEIIDDDSMATATATNLATAESIEARITAAFNGLSVDVDLLAGFVQRAKFTWSDVDTITIGPGRYHLLGTAQGENIYKWDSDITFDFGPGGSNANSEPLDVSEWHYLYIDDSSLSNSTSALVAANFMNDTNAPVWNASEGGWYHSGGNDRCIGAFYSNASSQLDEFWHVNTEIRWGSYVDLAHSWVKTTFTDQTMRVPAFATNQRVPIHVYGPANYYGWHEWRTNGSAGTGSRIGWTYNSGAGDNRRDHVDTDLIVITDSSGVVEFRTTVAAAGTASQIYQQGYVLPEGM